MKSSLRGMVFITWAFNMVSSQGFKTTPDDGETCKGCRHDYTFRGPRKGIFTSPKFPEKYPERKRCCYFFQARNDERVRIEFDYFDLESSDHDCRYDYIEILNYNFHGYPEQPKSLYCGTTIPPVHISTDSKLEIVFHSDVTTSANGFLGHFEFLQKNWHPFPPSTIGCGPGYLTGPGGSIYSPNYPGAYPPEAGCTWIIQAPKLHRILISFVSLDITNTGKCTDENLLMVFEGFFTPDKIPVRYCGQLEFEPETRREYLSQEDRLVIRFLSEKTNPAGNTGFHIVWTAVTLKSTGKCKGFQCDRVGTAPCDRTVGQDLCNDQHFCIDESMKCNELPNCGALDHSDENKCLNYIMRYVGIVGGCILVIVLIVIVTCICCYKKRCQRDRVKYSVPKEQSLTQSVTHSFLSTQSSNVPVRSLEHSPRSSCVMYTTSFTDCGTNEQLSSPVHNSRSNTNLNSFSNSNSLHLPNSVASNDTNDDVKDDVTESASYKGHQKRPSYHMMRELCYEDGDIVLADI